MDGPSVNVKLFKLKMTEKIKDCHIRQIEELVIYTLFMNHLKRAWGKSEWEMKSLMKASFNILCDSQARRNDYESVMKFSKFLLLFCVVRWIEDMAFADRLSISMA